MTLDEKGARDITARDAALILGAVAATAGLGTRATTPALSSRWYRRLDKPSWQPARAGLRAGVDSRLRAHRRLDGPDAPPRWRRCAAATVRAVRDQSRAQPRVDPHLLPRP